MKIQWLKQVALLLKVLQIIFKNTHKMYLNLGFLPLLG